MPTNEERRKVAARLRNYANLRESFKESPICAFINALGFGGYLDWKGVCSRLADLIEPEPERTCRNTTRHRYYGFECSECKWSAYEPNDYGNDVRFDDFNYCPHCGAKVASDA